MKEKRLVLVNQEAVYHVVFRTAYQSEKLTDESKKVFVSLLNKQKAFSGVQVVTYCLLDNHVHLLLRIPKRRKLEDKELIERYRALYGDDGSEYALPTPVLVKRLREGGRPAQALRDQLTSRMENLSVFVKELKQRFGIWYNRRHRNSGTLWSDRFKSVLVENNEEVIALVAAYIDMNPVRHKKCEQPQDYAFSGYATNPCYTLLKSKPSAQVDRMLKQKIGGMSGGKAIGSQSFVKSWEEQHQAGLKGKGRWFSSAVEHALWVCMSLTEVHHYRKWN